MTNVVQLINHPEKECNQGREYVKADTENGYYRVANELGLALCKTTLSDRESRLLQAVIIKTYGFNKAMDWVCNEQISELTDIDISNISKVKKSLLARKILLRDGKKIGVNPVVSEWQKKSESTFKKSELTSRKSESTIAVVRTDPHKRQDNITKDNNSIVTKSKSVRVRKPEAFKKLFSIYPEHRRGGTDAQAWKAWKSEKLTELDAETAVKWLELAAKTNPDWQTSAQGTFVYGITKFIRERIWLTPIPQPSFKKHADSNDTSWADGFKVKL